MNLPGTSRSRHLVDPELLPLVDAFPYIPLSQDTLVAFRERKLPPVTLSDPARDVELTYHFIKAQSDAPDVRLAIYRPALAATPLPVVLHIHGGGFVSGTLEALEPRHRELAAALGACIISVDYRLAPETRFPGAIEDCYAALSWLFLNADKLGLASTRVALMGESAGGGLAAALALMARDRGEFRPIFQHLVYPMLDDRTASGGVGSGYSGEFLWKPADNLFGWSSLLGEAPGQADLSPYAAPARATNLTGLPPTYIMTGALDLFADEGVEYARRLMAAGIPTELHVYPGAFHGFDLATWTSVGQAARQSGLTALARALRVTDAS